MKDESTEAVEVDDDEMDAELGYAECDWSTLPAESVESHDRILGMEFEALEALDLGSLDDLSLWAAAQAFWDFGDEDRFHDLALRIVRTKKPHPAIDAIEICMELVNDYMVEGAWDDVVFLLPDVERLVPDDETLRARLGAMVSIGRGRIEEGMTVFQELSEAHTRHPDVLFLLAHDLLAVGREEAGMELLDTAQEVAELENDDEVLDEIAEFRESLWAEQD